MTDHGSVVSQAVERQLQEYPASTLSDIYKSFFQDEFGPGHLLDDPAAARAWFDRELEEMTSKGRRGYEPCGIGRNFCRVSMDVVVDGVVDHDRFFDAFTEGAAGFRLPEMYSWMAEWNGILESIRPYRNEIPGFDDDAARIDATLRSGRYAMHHSSRYVATYDPHYRIMSVSVVDTLFSPSTG